jgi:cobalt-zinc-cadmium efflux system membrane fusion protein
MKRLFILLIPIVLAACGEKGSQSNEMANTAETDNIISVTKSQFENGHMVLGNVVDYQFNEVVKANGFIDVPPQNKASVSTFMGGFVKNTPLLIGDKVKKGQLVLTLENTEYVELQQQYMEVAEQLSYLKSEYERQQTLFYEKITSEKNFLKAESTYKSTLAYFNGLHEKLRMMNINPTSVEQGNISSTINLYSPISGYVTKVNVSNGSYISSQDEVLEIVNTDHIHLELSVFEKDIMKIKKGQIITFKVPESSGELFKAEVHLVGTSIDESTRTIKVHAHIEDEEKTRFIKGMFIEAEIITDAKTAKALPKDAVYNFNDSYFTLVLKDLKDEIYTFNKTEVKVGKQVEDFIEVLNPDDFNDKNVLTKGSLTLLSE